MHNKMAVYVKYKLHFADITDTALRVVMVSCPLQIISGQFRCCMARYLVTAILYQSIMALITPIYMYMHPPKPHFMGQF